MYGKTSLAQPVTTKNDRTNHAQSFDAHVIFLRNVVCTGATCNGIQRVYPTSPGARWQACILSRLPASCRHRVGLTRIREFCVQTVTHVFGPVSTGG